MNAFLRKRAVAFPLIFLSACSTLPAAGPSMKAINRSDRAAAIETQIHIVDVTDAVASAAISLDNNTNFADTLGEGNAIGALIGRGDVIDVTIWEAPPAALFGVSSAGGDVASNNVVTPLSVARSAALPEQMVGPEGTIRVPFAGVVPAAGRTTQQIAADIQARLAGKAHDPEVIVRLSRNAAANVTIVGEVEKSLRMPLTPKGERLLDALASAGGVRQPVGKMTIQLTRGSLVEAMPLTRVIKEPRQNVTLQADDVVTLLFQPYSFTVLGAARSNQEVPFEGTGLSLSQALGRMGGLDDQRANPKGVFIFRFEDPKMFTGRGEPVPMLTAKGKVPVIYRVNMKDPATMFVAQSFPIRDKDLVYISNAPLADFSKFLQAVSQVVFPIAAIQNTNIF